MTTQPLPPNFDPFATHPFTSFSSSPPKQKSQPIPTPHMSGNTSDTSTSPSSTMSTSFSPQSQAPIKSPKPQRLPSSSPPGKAPIFVPFRQETSSPELSEVLAKKTKSSSGEGKKS